MKITDIKKILVVAAHPDDEVLGCGATIAKHIENDDIVWVLILGEGVRSRRNLKPAAIGKTIKEIVNDARKAKKILGVEKFILKKFPDNQFDTVPLLKIIYNIEEVVKQLKPQIIYTHSSSDVNIDHRKTLEAIESVVRPIENSTINAVFSFEIPSSTNWNFTKQVFAPNVFNEISEQMLKLKIEAFRQYRTEIREFPHPRSEEYLEASAKVRGGQSGFGLAEAFELVFCRSQTVMTENL